MNEYLVMVHEINIVRIWSVFWYILGMVLQIAERLFVHKNAKYKAFSLYFMYEFPCITSL